LQPLDHLLILVEIQDSVLLSATQIILQLLAILLILHDLVLNLSCVLSHQFTLTNKLRYSMHKILLRIVRLNGAKIISQVTAHLTEQILSCFVFLDALFNQSNQVLDLSILTFKPAHLLCFGVSDLHTLLIKPVQLLNLFIL
jgi:hypothetical protein